VYNDSVGDDSSGVRAVALEEGEFLQGVLVAFPEVAFNSHVCNFCKIAVAVERSLRIIVATCSATVLANAVSNNPEETAMEVEPLEAEGDNRFLFFDSKQQSRDSGTDRGVVREHHVTTDAPTSSVPLAKGETVWHSCACVEAELCELLVHLGALGTSSSRVGKPPVRLSLDRGEPAKDAGPEKPLETAYETNQRSRVGKPLGLMRHDEGPCEILFFLVAAWWRMWLRGGRRSLVEWKLQQDLDRREGKRASRHVTRALFRRAEFRRRERGVEKVDTLS
jgi:hypothetical protein